MVTQGGGDLFGELVTAFADSLKTWSDMVTLREGDYQRRLAGRAVAAYASQLADTKQFELGLPLQPASFVMYALCVEAIFQTLLDDHPSNTPETIVVSTLLTIPLWQWYNIAVEEDEEGVFVYTRQEWETYKNNVVKVRVQRGHNPRYPVHMRRIVSLADKRYDLQNLYVLSGDALSVSDARRRVPPGCLELIPEVSHTLERDDSDDGMLVHLLATHHAGVACDCERSEWQPLLQNFKSQYHDGTQQPGHEVSPTRRGVFCAFTDAVQRGYSDVFIVDMTSSGKGAFGVAWHVDRERDFGGWVVLSEDKMREELAHLEELWKPVGGSR